MTRLIRVETDLTTALDAGDYALAGYEHLARVERKGSVAELMGNLFTRDRARQERALTKLISSCKYPYLLLDFPAREAMTSPYVRDPQEVMCEVYRLCAWRGLRLLWLHPGADVASRRNVGTQIVHILWQHAWHDIVQRATRKGDIDGSSRLSEL